jgi:ectoine hydroxylase-related dioxygenase (phytanoyl-CoA dioxygenase family)
MTAPAIAELARARCLLDLARMWVGPNAVPFRATLFEKSAGTNWLIPWHQDTALPLRSRFDAPGWGPWSEKAEVAYAHAPAWALERVVALRVHLDASGADNGPLRVLPGSHSAGVLTDDQVAAYVKEHEPRECLVERGGVLAMRPLLIHASSKARGDQPRRVLHIEYVDDLDLAAGIELAVT